MSKQTPEQIRQFKQSQGDFFRADLVREQVKAFASLSPAQRKKLRAGAAAFRVGGGAK